MGWLQNVMNQTRADLVNKYNGNVNTGKINNLSSQNTLMKSQISDRLKAGNNITLNKPNSERYTNLPGVTGRGLYDDFKGKGSPEGFVSERTNTQGELTQDIPSTAIQTIKYNPQTKQLNVRFVGGHINYTYPNVPIEKIEGLMNAPSKGQYFMKNIHKQYSMNAGKHYGANVKKPSRAFYRKTAKAHAVRNQQDWYRNHGIKR